MSMKIVAVSKLRLYLQPFKARSLKWAPERTFVKDVVLRSI